MQHSASFRVENSTKSTEICPWSSSIHHCLSFKAAAEFLKVQTPPVDVETKEIKKVAIIIQRCVYTYDLISAILFSDPGLVL